MLIDLNLCRIDPTLRHAYNLSIQYHAFQTFSNNQHNKDYIVGDIHDNEAILKQVLDILPLRAEDRLFIVGDLFDRGSAPSAVFKLLETHKNIFSVRGNHEEREWFKIWIEEIKNNLKKCDILPSKKEISDIAFTFKEASKLRDLSRILQYVECLPYIIRVAPNDPYGFIVCHSDLPFSDIDLHTKRNLTAREIAQLT